MENVKHLDTIKGINEQIDSLDKEINSFKSLAVSMAKKTLVVCKELESEGNKLRTNLEELAKKFTILQEEYDERQGATDTVTKQENVETLQKQLSQEMENAQQLRAQIHELDDQNNELVEILKEKEAQIAKGEAVIASLQLTLEKQKKIKIAYQLQLSAEDVYAKGIKSYERGDYSEAVEWYQIAAEQGEARAQYDLGLMYANGKGVPKDASEAVKWYLKAAVQGYVSAQNTLGWRYLKGEGVLQDASEAEKWYQRAAAQGNASAQYNLGWMYENGQGVLQDDLKAIKWYRKAAEQEYVRAQTNLGDMYRKGKGVPQDDSEAIKWYLRAAKQGNADAQEKLKTFYK